jgi:ornithine cyclodeaminase/alanine dehydrogenase-like protein (mu-crystallin family)
MDDKFAKPQTRLDAPSVLVLSRSSIAALLSPPDYLMAVETAFRAEAEGRTRAPAPLHIPAESGGFHAKGAYLALADDRAFAAVKVNGNFPGNPKRNGLPTIQGAIVLSDANTGALLALMDSIEVTLRRTAAATALAMRSLARPDADVVSICGCGDQARAQLEAIADARRIRKVYAVDIDPSARARFAKTLTADLRLDIVAEPDLAKAARASGIIVTCTTSRTPFLGRDHVAPGTFVAAVGADAPDKSELMPDLMAIAKVVVDSPAQCTAMGDLHHAIAARAIPDGHFHATLSDLVAGRKPGRTNADEITIFDSTGVAIQDVAAAIRIYERASAQGTGLAIQLAL